MSELDEGWAILSGIQKPLIATSEVQNFSGQAEVASAKAEFDTQIENQQLLGKPLTQDILKVWIKTYSKAFLTHWKEELGYTGYIGVLEMICQDARIPVEDVKLILDSLSRYLIGKLLCDCTEVKGILGILALVNASQNKGIPYQVGRESGQFYAEHMTPQGMLRVSIDDFFKI